MPPDRRRAARAVEGNPIEVRDALCRYFVDGRIVVTPVAEGDLDDPLATLAARTEAV